MPKIEWKGTAFDSVEELEMYWWCQEAAKYSLIASFEYQKPTWTLAESVKEEVPRFGKGGQSLKPAFATILQGATYTCDFHIVGALHGIPVPEYVDVKPKFTRDEARLRIFSIKQKWLYQQHGILVKQLLPMDLFEATFAPAESRVTQVRREPRKAYCHLLTVEQFVNNMALGK